MKREQIYESFDSELVLVGAPSMLGLAEETARLASFLEQAPGVLLEDVAYTCALNAKNQNCIAALVVSSVADLLERLRPLSSRIADGADRIRDKNGTYYFREKMAGRGAKAKLAFFYPGAASFYPDMFRDLAIFFPQAREPFDELEEALGGEGLFSPSTYVFPPAAYYRSDADVFESGGYAQCLVSAYSANMAMTRLLAAAGVKPDAVFGYSGGDLSALAAAGAFGSFNRSERVEFVRSYYRIIRKVIGHKGVPECTAVAVIAPKTSSIAAISGKLPAGKVALCMVQTARQAVAMVMPEAEEEVFRILAGEGAHAIRLPFRSPINTPWCEKAVPLMRDFASDWISCRPSLPVYSCSQARRLERSSRAVRHDAVDQWTREIRFADTVRRLYDDGCRVFVEAGPRGAFCQAIDEILSGEKHFAIPANRIHRNGLLQLHHALGMLAALGADVDATFLHGRRRKRKLDFDSPLSFSPRLDTEFKLSRALPRMALFSDTGMPGTKTSKAENRAAARAIAAQARERRQRQFDFGAVAPLTADADILDQTPGVSLEIAKTLSLQNEPFIADFSYGCGQVSYTDPSLHGLTPLPLFVAAEMMAELAQRVVPTRQVVAVENFTCRRFCTFSENGRLNLNIRAERTGSDSSGGLAGVRVQLRDDSPNSEFTWSVMEAVFMLSPDPPGICQFVKTELANPRNIHWTDRDIYPGRLRYGHKLRLVRRADAWSETGLDYEIEVPSNEGCISGVRFPIWIINPLMFEAAVSGFTLWRAHEKNNGSVSVPFRMRKLTLHAGRFPEGERLRCYLRLTAVTPRSHICDISVSDGNGTLVAQIRGWEEIIQRAPSSYRELVLSPATTFLSSTLPPACLATTQFPVATAMVSEIDYQMFENSEELWLKLLAGIVLCPEERREFSDMTGSVSRRAEWLFGRLAAKEAVRRFLLENYQARWSDADIQIWPDDSGKPHPIGAWADSIPVRLDLTIAHTSKLVMAVVASNARAGVDIESASRDLSDEFTRGVFNPEELNIAAGAVYAQNVLLRFWCAKEAVSKALGTGIRYSPKDMVVVSFNPATGEMAMRLREAWLGAFKEFTGRDIMISSTVVREHVLASCFLPPVKGRESF